MVILGQRGIDLGQFHPRLRRAEEAGQHPQRFVLAPLDHQIARTLRNGQQQQQEQQRRRRHHPEHPAPGRLAGPQRPGGGARGVGQQVVAQERGEQAADDGDLLHRGQPAAITRRRHLGDVGRRHHAGRADRETAQHAGGHEDQRTGRRAGAERRQQEQHRRNDQYAAAPPAIGQAAGEERADRAAQQHRRHLEAQPRLARSEGLLQAVHGTVDDPAVESEQESADGRHHADQHDQPGVLVVRQCLAHVALPSFSAWPRRGRVRVQRSRYWLSRFS